MPPRGCTSPLVLPWPFCSLPLNRRRRGIRCGVSLKGNIHYSRREERTYQVYSGRVIPLRKNSANVNGVNVRGNERWRWVCEETSWTPFSWYWKISASSTMKWPLPWPWNGCCFGICLHPAQQEWHKGEKKKQEMGVLCRWDSTVRCWYFGENWLWGCSESRRVDLFNHSWAGEFGDFTCKSKRNAWQKWAATEFDWINSVD